MTSFAHVQLSKNVSGCACQHPRKVIIVPFENGLRASKATVFWGSLQMGYLQGTTWISDEWNRTYYVVYIAVCIWTTSKPWEGTGAGVYSWRPRVEIANTSCGTNYPPSIYDPLKWSKESYYEELARVQK
ncbi:hypothetical protein NQ315_014565 [Exocentrus adspersus]|uniref:Uncharacterized protein n=1 Tax=Exocentrus adspersus TaxID=1586481 RepID=A0AAV8VL23_9CUCU|nr:hypothetical protein NQ315_014565 [Exocentrus adspersus]